MLDIPPYLDPRLGQDVKKVHTATIQGLNEVVSHYEHELINIQKQRRLFSNLRNARDVKVCDV